MTRLLGLLGDCLDGQQTADAAAATALGAALDAARSTWPALAVDDEVIVPFVVQRLEPGPVGAALERLEVSDLYLACACLHGVPEAIASFRDHHVAGIERAVRQFASAEFVEEVVQRTMAKLLVASEGELPAIARFGGRGPLSAWAQTVAVRDARGLRRAAGRRKTREDMFALVDRAIVTPDPELLAMKRLYRGVFRETFEEAFAELTTRERALLRYQFLDRLTVDGIGRIYGVSRATAARWTAQARRALIERTRAMFAARLSVDSVEYQSIMRLIRSQIDLSLPTTESEATEGEPAPNASSSSGSATH